MAVIAKYKFNSTLYADLVPEFNAEFTNYTVTDEATETDSEGNVIKTRVIEHDTLLPTLMRFGRVYVEGESATDNRTDSLLEVLDMNTSELTSCSNMFRYNTNLTSITCEWDTSKVTDMGGMFQYCNNLTSLDVSNFDTSKVTNMHHMFQYCNNLTSLDVSNFDTSKVTDMSYIFWDCYNLTSLDVSNWDTSNVRYMNHMFVRCQSLTTLDLSNFNTSNVTTMDSIFWECTNLTTLDLSNFNTSKVTNMQSMFYNTPLLTDIGMLYCSQSTINALSSNITTPSTNVWVEGSMIDDLTSYDNVTYKPYYWEKEVLLNSPLLEGDKIVKKEGKIYHYHKMGMITFDGSEDDWTREETDYGIGAYRAYTVNHDIPSGEGTFNLKTKSILYSNLLPYISEEQYKETPISGVSSNYAIGIKINNVSNLDGFKQWLQENPLTVVYELANPYYELISDTSDDLSLSLLSEDNIISNNSLIPTNMNVKNNGMSTVAMNTSTKYTVAFDKDTDSSVTIDLCGSTIDTTDNVVEITTPSELANNEITFIGDCEVSNVRILEGSVSGDAIPRESFEGLKNSFEDGYIPESMITQSEVQFSGLSLQEDWYFTDNSTSIDYTGVKILKDYKDRLEIGKTYTFMLTVTNTYTSDITFKDGYDIRGVDAWYDVATLHAGETKTIVLARNYNTNIEVYNVFNFGATQSGVSYKVNKNIIVLEGDWTHLTEEDFNNLGKYKVEYKVTGKNKFDNSLELYNAASNYVTWEFINDGYKLTTAVSSKPRVCNHSEFNVEKGKSYIVSANINVCSGNLGTAGLRVAKINADGIIGATIMYLSKNSNASFTPDGTYDKIAIQLYGCSHEGTTEIAVIEYTDIQLEEGTTATPYEPYKEYTKTFYLNSPLLEGDTIEDVNGVATHVKRYGKVVLDGSEDEVLGASSLNPQTSHTTRFYFNFDANKVYPPARILTQNESPIILTDSVFSDNFGVSRATITGSDNDTVVHRLISLMRTNSELRFVLPSSELSVRDLSGFRQWLQQNPTTVVYQLASPIYEPISTESILCDSYVNGHLDVDSNIPIEKVQFSRTPNISTKYLYPNTPYVLQFESDNIGKLNLSLANCYTEVDIIKGVNKISLPLADIPHNYLVLNGIGFNASNIQIVATERDNIGYFKGIQSSFEDKVIRSKNLFNKNNVTTTIPEGISTGGIDYYFSEYIECKPNTVYTCNVGTNFHYFDENKVYITGVVHGSLSPSNAKYLVKAITTGADLSVIQIEEGATPTTYEPYDKYAVEVSMVGKNKWKYGDILNKDVYQVYLDEPLKKGNYVISSTCGQKYESIPYIAFLNDEETIVGASLVKDGRLVNISKDINRIVIYSNGNNYVASSGKPMDFTDIQLEEGTTKTEYEPYKATRESIYLNSPLLKGDKIEMYNGKLCHYHKMGKVVLDGSEDEEWEWFTSNIGEGNILNQYGVQLINHFHDTTYSAPTLYCDKFRSSVITDRFHDCNIIFTHTRGCAVILPLDSKIQGEPDFRQWLQANPTTVVYELLEPYYEDITPIQNEFVITSIGESSFTIDSGAIPTDGEITYSVNVKLLNDLEESINNNTSSTDTDLSTILDDIINE